MYVTMNNQSAFIAMHGHSDPNMNLCMQANSFLISNNISGNITHFNYVFYSSNVNVINFKFMHLVAVHSLSCEESDNNNLMFMYHTALYQQTSVLPSQQLID